MCQVWRLRQHVLQIRDGASQPHWLSWLQETLLACAGREYFVSRTLFGVVPVNCVIAETGQSPNVRERALQPVWVLFCVPSLCGYRHVTPSSFFPISLDCLLLKERFCNCSLASCSELHGHCCIIHSLSGVFHKTHHLETRFTQCTALNESRVRQECRI